MVIESIDGIDYLCVLEGMTGARLNIGACVTRGPSTDAIIADGVIREKSRANGAWVSLSGLGVDDEVVESGLSRSRQADGPSKQPSGVSEVYKSWKGRLRPSEESWLTSLESWIEF